MSQNTAPFVICDRLHPGLNVGDINEAVKHYTEQLGFTLGFTWGDPPDMAGVNFGNVSIHLFQDTTNAAAGNVYFVIENVDELYEFHRSNGIHIFAPPANKPYEMRDYHIRDLFGNI